MPRPRLKPGETGKISEAGTRGAYTARCRIGRWSGQEPKLRTGKGRTKADALKDLERRVAEERRRGGADAGKRFSDLAEEWITYRRNRGTAKDRTLALYEGTMRRHLIPRLGGVAREDLDRRTCMRALDDILASGITGDQPRAVLRMMLGWATDRGYLPANPIAGLRQEKKKGEEPEIETISEESTARLLRRLEKRCAPTGRGGRSRSRDVYEMSLLIAGTGLRIGEALGLRNIDLDLAAAIPYLSVEGTLVEPYEGHPTLEWSPIPKTPNSYRNLALHPAIVDMLLERRKRTKWRRQTDPVFASEQAGTWLWPNNIRTRLRGDVAETEWVGVTPHTLRRGLATVLYYEVGTDLAASALGHAQGGVTHRHYIDRSRRPVIDVRPYVGALLSQGPETPPDARSASKT